MNMGMIGPSLGVVAPGVQPHHYLADSASSFVGHLLPPYLHRLLWFGLDSMYLEVGLVVL